MRSQRHRAGNAFSTTVSGHGLDGLAFDAGSGPAARHSQAAADAARDHQQPADHFGEQHATDVLDGVTLTLNAETIDAVTVSVAPTPRR